MILGSSHNESHVMWNGLNFCMYPISEGLSKTKEPRAYLAIIVILE